MVGCYEGPIGPDEPTVGNISLSPESMEVGAGQGEYSVDVYTDYVYQATSNVDWIEISDKTYYSEYSTQYFIVKQNTSDSSREGTITFYCDDYNLTATLTVNQKSQSAMFYVACNPETLSCGYADILVSAVDPEMLYLAVTSQELGQYGVTGKDKEELMNNYMTLLAQNYMLYGQPDNWFVYKGNMADAGVYKSASRYTAEENVTVYVVGFTPVTTMEVEEGGETMVYVTEAKLATSIIEYVVPFLPYPTLTVPEAQLSNNVTAAAGEVVVDCVLTNALSDGTAVELQTEAAWVHPTWADNKLTIAYDANTTAVARRAKIAVMYGYYTNPFEVTVVQEKDPNAVAVTLTITVKGTQFNGILVDVVPSDPTATYALNFTTPEKDWETGAELPIDWMSKAEELLSYTGRTTFHTGNLTDHFIKTDVSNYEWTGLEHYVYAIPVAATSEGDNWTVSQILGDVAVSEKVTIDLSKMPKVDWVVEGSGLVWNESNERYDLEVVEGSTVTLSFTVTNPVEGASLKLNGKSLYDSYNVVDGEPVIDNAAGTITFKIDAFDTTKKNHYVQPGFKYTNETDDVWGVMLPTLRLTQVQAPAADTPATPAE